jgi:hypothetical protein
MKVCGKEGQCREIKAGTKISQLLDCSYFLDDARPKFSLIHSFIHSPAAAATTTAWWWSEGFHALGSLAHNSGK